MLSDGSRASFNLRPVTDDDVTFPVTEHRCCCWTTAAATAGDGRPTPADDGNFLTSPTVRRAVGGPAKFGLQTAR